MKDIDELERKRERSQAALIEAILQNKSPNDQDVDFFNNYSAQINHWREKISELQASLDSMKK